MTSFPRTQAQAEREKNLRQHTLPTPTRFKRSLRDTGLGRWEDRWEESPWPRWKSLLVIAFVTLLLLIIQN